MKNAICHMTFDEEISLTQTEREERSDAMIIAANARSIMTAAEQLLRRAEGIPLDGTPEHAELVKELAKLTKRAEAIAWSAATFGII